MVPFSGCRNKSFSCHLPLLAIPSAVHSTPSAGVLYLPWMYYTFCGCTIPSVGVLKLPWVNYTFRGCTIPSVWPRCTVPDFLCTVQYGIELVCTVFSRFWKKIIFARWERWYFLLLFIESKKNRKKCIFYLKEFSQITRFNLKSWKKLLELKLFIWVTKAYNFMLVQEL